MDEGLLFVGDRGKILCEFSGGESKTDSRSEDEKLQTAAENVAEITGKRTRMARCL